MTKAAITLTEKALVHARELLEDAPDGTAGLRVSIVSAGCSGHKYQFDYAHESEIPPTDTPVEQDGIKIFIDRDSLMFLLGSVMDYEDAGFKSGFTFENPHVASACGCGESVQFTRDDLEEKRV